MLPSASWRFGGGAESSLLYCAAIFSRTPVPWSAVFVLAAASLAFWARFALGLFGAV